MIDNSDVFVSLSIQQMADIVRKGRQDHLLIGTARLGAIRSACAS